MNDHVDFDYPRLFSDNKLTLGIRLILELRPFLREHYNDYIRDCSLCAELMTKVGYLMMSMEFASYLFPNGLKICHVE